MENLALTAKIEEATYVCFRTDSPGNFVNRGKLKDMLDKMKDEAASNLQRLVEVDSGNFFLSPSQRVATRDHRDPRYRTAFPRLRCALCFGCVSENDLYPELDVPAVAGASNLPNVRISDGRHRKPEMGLVEAVERLRPDLELEAVPKPEVFHQGKV